MCEEEWKGYCLKSKKDEGEEVVKHKIGVQGSLNENDDSRRCLCPAMLVIARSRLSLSRSRSLSLALALARSAYFSPAARSRSIRGIFFYFTLDRLHCGGNFEVPRIPRIPPEERGIITCPGQMLKNASHRQPLVIPVDVLSPRVSPAEKLWARPRFRPL